MIEVSVLVEGLGGLTWPLWKRLVEAVEAGGFAGLFFSDHFLFPDIPTVNSLELIVALTYLADHTQRIHFGSLVAPFSFRDPVMLARQAAVLSDLSDGRMRLGLGAGWMDYEHQMFGYNLGDMKTRMDRFSEGMEVITRLLRNTEPVSYDGQFYQLREATIPQWPHYPGGLPILVGGEGLRRTLPLVARYADIWNMRRPTPDTFRALSAKLDELVRAAGREPNAIKRTILMPIICWRDTAELERCLQPYRQIFPKYVDTPVDALLDEVRGLFTTVIVGASDEVIHQIRAYESVGVEELIIQWFGVEDVEGLQVIAEQVLPHVSA